MGFSDSRSGIRLERGLLSGRGTTVQRMAPEGVNQGELCIVSPGTGFLNLARGLPVAQTRRSRHPRPTRQRLGSTTKENKLLQGFTASVGQRPFWGA